MKNIFFSDGTRNLYGTRFGVAVEYNLEVNENGRCVLSFQPKTIQAEGPYYPSHTKAQMVSECTYRVAQEKQTVILMVYGKEILVTKKETMEEIHTEIIAKVKQIFTIDKTVPLDVQRQANAILNNLVQYIDIF